MGLYEAVTVKMLPANFNSMHNRYVVDNVSIACH
jgi:hypothetical protein